MEGNKTRVDLGETHRDVVTHPLFPAIGPSGSLTCKEQFAGRRALGSDLAALSLSILISLCDHPLFVVFTDAVSAYDRVWKQALYAKLARQHHSLAEVKQLAMLYEWMESVIKNGNEISDVISSIIGIAQGGAKSAELFCAFMADLPEDIRASCPACDFGGLVITCLMYMDDYAIPSFSEESLHLSELVRVGLEDIIVLTSEQLLNSLSGPDVLELGQEVKGSLR